MKIEIQYRILILLSIIELGGIGKKKDVLDKLSNDDYISLNNRDREILTSRPEARWRNSLAFSRQHLKEEGYLIPSSNNKWEVSLDGFDYFIRLLNENDLSQDFDYISSKCLYRLNKYKNEYSLQNDEVVEDNETEASYNAKRRIGQKNLRKKLLKHSNCFLCGIDIENLLVCSHIKPWKDSSNTERLDANNALLLCSLHDKLFDKGYISFNENGRIMISKDIELAKRKEYKLKSSLSIRVNKRNSDYIEWHRNNIFRIGG